MINTKITSVFFFVLVSLSNVLYANQSDMESDYKLYKIAKKLKYQKPDSAILIIDQIIRNNNLKDSALYDVIESAGDAYWHKSDYTQSIQYYKKAHELAFKINNKPRIAKGYSNLGYLYKEIAQYDKAIEYLKKAMEIALENNFSNHYLITSTYLANVYGEIKQYELANRILKDALNKVLAIQDSSSVAVILNNLGSNYLKSNQLDTAEYYYKKALEIDRRNNNTKEVAINQISLAEIYYRKGNYKESLRAAFESEQIFQNYKVSAELSSNLLIIAKAYLELGNREKTLNYMNEAVLLTEKVNALGVTTATYGDMSLIYSKLGIMDSAFKYLELYSELNDSIFRLEGTTKIAQMAAQIDLSKKEKEIELLSAEKKMQLMELKNQRNKQYFLYGGILFLLIFAGVMYNRFKITQQQKRIIEVQKVETEKQKQIVEEKNKEISDSIIYAKRIQEAILPSRYSLTEHLKNGFVLYKPKDIVSGDFYWLEKYKESIYFAAADCTGHGVPGAMVSVVCANALSKALLEENQTETGKLLDRTRELVVERFTRNDENVKDGMDISLCRITKNRLQWSGANNPLWIIRKDSNSVEEIKANKQPVGKTDNFNPFDTHELELNSGDSIYIFTDGFADQFGGNNGKKFMYKQFKELLLSNSHLEMNEQKEKLNQSFIEWQGKQEQVDDICVIGVRV
ncbi:MAG: tetratricopeptide repeat protein [Flavobacteriales bacterium]|nr:tetratricopeptide repeat protein [Flavobacteriales bacterium]